jgi:spermidine synthase
MKLQEKREYHTSSSGIFFEAQRTLFEKKSRYQKIEVIENPYFGRMLFLDGLVQTTEKDEFFYHEMLIQPAMVDHPNPRKILIIGGGDGGALRQSLQHPVELVRMVEIDPDVLSVAKQYFPWLVPGLKDDRTDLVVADGREYLDSSSEKYDIVFVDSSEPVGPSVSLHGKSFYALLKDRLFPDGIVCAQMGSPFFQLESLKRAKKEIKDIFKIARFYMAPVPTYPGGNWCYVFLSDRVDPLATKRDPSPDLQFYNLEIHRAAFALPNYLQKILKLP